MEKIYGKTEECCGCGACAEICPRGCIQMCMDREGFLYPVVDRERCVACGLCQRICPTKNAVARGDAIRGHYLAYVKDEKLRWNSSSGGVFSVLAEAILKNGGVVFGAAFDEDFSVHHIGVKDSSGLDALRGSKYVESRTEHSFSEAKAVLESGKPVLFSGTPCQIAGLMQYLGKNYDRLYTVDLLCHGVPSPKVWKMYLNFQISAHRADIKRTLFRQKDFGWKAFAVKLQFDNLTAYEQIFEKDLFMQMFLQNICLRPACYACKFKHLNRVSDFTIGDAWGVENYMPEMDDDKGTSVILVHTKKGEKLLNEVQEQMKMMPGREGQLLPSVLASRSSVSRHPRRKQFFQKLDQVKSFDELAVFLKVSLPRKVVRKMKRGLKKLWGS